MQAYYSFQMALHIRSNKGFKFEDFMDLLGADYMEEMRKKDYQRSRDYIDQLRANGEDY